MMSSPAQVDNNQSPTPNKKVGNIQAILLFAIIFLPLAFAYGIFKTGYGMPSDTINKGLLLKTASQVSSFSVEDREGLPLLSTGKKWRLLIPYSKSCNKDCEDILYVTRQVHIRLGEKARRVERVLVSLSNDAEQYKTLQEEHPRLRIMEARQSEFAQWLSNLKGENPELTAHSYYLVDENGFAMMAYNGKHHGNELLTDIKRVLKFSNED